MPSPELEIAQDDVARIVAAAAERRGVDLRAYLPGPLARGIALRARAEGFLTARDYAAHLERRPEELAELLEAVLVPFSALFRDPEVFQALEQIVVPTIAAGLERGDLLRAWVAGVATGEEAWSLGAVVARACPAGPEFRVLGSDVSVASLGIARAGRYPAAGLPGRWRAVTAALLWDDGDAVVPSDLLRARVAFARHDLLGASVAPPEAILASFHLVMVRNVLIYMERTAQRRALDRVLSTVERGGALVLGPVETTPERLSRAVECFPGVDPRLRVYRVGGSGAR